jgi:hypothetical protein
VPRRQRHRVVSHGVRDDDVEEAGGGEAVGERGGDAGLRGGHARASGAALLQGLVERLGRVAQFAEAGRGQAQLDQLVRVGLSFAKERAGRRDGRHVGPRLGIRRRRVAPDGSVIPRDVRAMMAMRSRISLRLAMRSRRPSRTATSFAAVCSSICATALATVAKATRPLDDSGNRS